jgi:hypothetical protein
MEGLLVYCAVEMTRARSAKKITKANARDPDCRLGRETVNKRRATSRRVRRSAHRGEFWVVYLSEQSNGGRDCH